jgi:sporulation protein YlmC with PRC-barrel domain
VIRATDLIGCVVRTESGEELGRVHDLRAHLDGDAWLLMGLVVGRGGLAERFSGSDEDAVSTGEVVAWEAIVRLEDGLITVRDVVAPVVS